MYAFLNWHGCHLFSKLPCSLLVINARCGDTAGNEQCSEAHHVLDNFQAAYVVVRTDGYCLQRLPVVADVHPNLDRPYLWAYQGTSHALGSAHVLHLPLA